MTDLSSRVTVIAIGINKYHDRNLRNVKGADKDIEKLKNIVILEFRTNLLLRSKFNDDKILFILKRSVFYKKLCNKITKMIQT